MGSLGAVGGVLAQYYFAVLERSYPYKAMHGCTPPTPLKHMPYTTKVQLDSLLDRDQVSKILKDHLIAM